MTDFQTQLTQHLAAQLGQEVEKVIKALNSFGTSEEPESPSKKKIPAKSKAVSKKKEEKHTCERTPRGRDAPCGKRARNQIELADGTKHWYCGTEKSGCTKSIMGQLKKEKEKKAAQEINEETIRRKKAKSSGGSKTLDGAKKEADKKLLSLLEKKKIVPFAKIQAKKFKTKSHGTIWFDHGTRVIFNKASENQEAYGILGKDNDTILPLGEKEMKWLDKLGISFVKPEENEKQTASPAQSESEEELPSDSEDEHAESDSSSEPELSEKDVQEEPLSGNDSEEEFDLDDM